MKVLRRRRALYALATVILICLSGSMLPAFTHRTRRNADALPLQSLGLPEERHYVLGGARSPDDGPHARHAFNVEISDGLPSDRPLPDTRNEKCHGKVYSIESYKTTTVIICFHNEARSALLRTVISVLNRTPSDLLQEIILVDDYSDDDKDGGMLVTLPKVKLIRNMKREGLVRSRTLGSKTAIGNFIMFLDSHCEVNVGWLEPLLARLCLDPRAIASPVIDVIDHDTLEYRASSASLKGGFDWGLHFKWIPLSYEERQSRDPSESFPSPAISGGLFLVHRSYFLELGSFDSGLGIWGAESLEMSLKAWMCGGLLEVVPCSRIGHIFRKRHPYTFPDGNAYTHLRNTKRIAEVWLQEYKQFYYNARPGAVVINAGDLSEQRKLKENLYCQSFKWYLENVFKELKLPNEENSAFGEIRQDSLCLTATPPDFDSVISLVTCNDAAAAHWTLHRSTGNVRLTNDSGAKPELCLAPRSKQLIVENCTDEPKQVWKRVGAAIVHAESGLCVESGVGGITLGACRRGAPPQLWDFTVELQTLQDTSVNIR